MSGPARPSRRTAAVVLAGLGLSACSLAPDYQTPSTVSPPAFKENGEWKAATPLDALPKGVWWTVFGDPELDRLEARLTDANQDLKVAYARLAEARAAALALRGQTLPEVAAAAGSSRDRRSKNLTPATVPSDYSDHSLSLNVSYEIDLWGRVRNTVEAGENRAQASAGDLAAVDLSLRAELAADYFDLRGADAQQEVLDQAVDSYGKALALTRSRFQGGAAAEIDVDQAEETLETAKTQAGDNRLARAQLEHAIAILTGAEPSVFTLPARILTGEPPAIDPGLPSQLLERRPDVAAAERRVAAANAEIGVARAAFFPVFSLTGLIGLEAASPASWIEAPSTIWAMGGSSLLTLFDNGRRQALSDQARAAHDEAAAAYRGTVLQADREVEDNLAALRQLERNAGTQRAAVDAAGRALTQAQNRYKGGLSTYLEVVTRQNAALTAQLSAVGIWTRRMVASVLLVKAIGGGWQADPAAPPHQISEANPPR